MTPTTRSIDSDTGEFAVTVSLDAAVSSHQVTLIAADDLGNRSEMSFSLTSNLFSSIVSLHLYEGDTDKTELPLTEGAHTLKRMGKTANGQLAYHLSAG